MQAIENYTFVAADGVLMPLEEGTSAFITMNPGYIGRAELPESLKVLHLSFFCPADLIILRHQGIVLHLHYDNSS